MLNRTNFVDWTVILSNGFDKAINIVIGSEGSKLDLSRNDKGNWTGGAVGHGRLAGSKFGISAASYPHVDIASLTYEQAKAIYRKDFATLLHFNELPTLIGTVVLDAAINNGLSRAVKWLQSIVGVTVDGVMGPTTITALHKYASDSASVLTFCAVFSNKRLSYMSGLKDWPREGGWAKRLSHLPYRAIAALTLEQ